MRLHSPQLPAPRFCPSSEGPADNDGSKDWYQSVTAWNQLHYEEFSVLETLHTTHYTLHTTQPFAGGLAQTNPLLTEVPIVVQRCKLMNCKPNSFKIVISANCFRQRHKVRSKMKQARSYHD